MFVIYICQLLDNSMALGWVGLGWLCSYVILIQLNMTVELSNMRKKKKKRTIECNKRTITCVVETTQCENGTAKCEKKK